MRIILLLLLLIIPSRASAEWTQRDTQMETLYMVTHCLDWSQTRTIATHPNKYKEYNTLLGEHPRREQVDLYFVLTGVAHVAIAYVLPDDYRRGFQWLTTGMELTMIANNLYAGIHFSF